MNVEVTKNIIGEGLGGRSFATGTHAKNDLKSGPFSGKTLLDRGGPFC